jgi:hypothetical protein
VGQAAVTSTTRDIAQAGALAGAIFGALVGADPFDVRNRTAWVKNVDYIAIALWVGAVLLFLFVAAAAARLWMALLVAGAAGVLTMAALIAVPFDFSEDHDDVALRLTPQAQRAISDLCHVTTTPLRGGSRRRPSGPRLSSSRASQRSVGPDATPSGSRQLPFSHSRSTLRPASEARGLYATHRCAARTPGATGMRRGRPRCWRRRSTTQRDEVRETR